MTIQIAPNPFLKMEVLSLRSEQEIADAYQALLTGVLAGAVQGERDLSLSTAASTLAWALGVKGSEKAPNPITNMIDKAVAFKPIIEILLTDIAAKSVQVDFVS